MRTKTDAAPPDPRVLFALRKRRAVALLRRSHAINKPLHARAVKPFGFGALDLGGDENVATADACGRNGHLGKGPDGEVGLVTLTAQDKQ